MNKTFISLAVCGSLLSMSGLANAVQYEWNFNSNVASGHKLTFSDGAGHDLDVYAFRSGNTASSGTEVGTRNLVDADVNPDGTWGLGVTNGTEGSPDDRYLDNRYGVDVLVFDSGVANFDWNFLKLGFIDKQYGDDTPGVQYWTGGNNLDLDTNQNALNALCLHSTVSNSCTTLANSSYGFTKQSQLDVSQTGTSQPLSATAKGRYLVVSGALDGSGGGGYDKFKISTVPAPQTVSLVGIGLLGMFLFRRRKTASSSARNAKSLVVV